MQEQQDDQKDELFDRFHQLSRREQHDLVNIAKADAEETLKTYHVLAAEDLLATREARMRQMGNLMRSEATLSRLENRLLKWIETDDEVEAGGVSQFPGHKPKDAIGTRKAKLRTLTHIVNLRKQIAQTTQILGEPTQPTIKGPAFQKNTQNNYFEGGAPNPKDDFKNFKAK